MKRANKSRKHGKGPQPSAYAVDFRRGVIQRQITEALARPLPPPMLTWARI